MNIIDPLIAKVYAAGLTLPNPLCPQSQDCTILSILETITRYLIAIAIPITAIMVIWGGYQIMTAGASGESEKFKSGIKTVTYAAIGFGVVLVSWGVISVIKELLSGS